MTTIYVAACTLGVLSGVLGLLWCWASRPGKRIELQGYRDDEMTVPGARIEQSDEYAVEGGAGGAEGEGGSPGYQDGADGGIGGAEGGSYGPGAEPSARRAFAIASPVLSGFGAAGIVLGELLQWSQGVTFAVSLAVGIILGLLAIPVLRCLTGPEEGK